MNGENVVELESVVKRFAGKAAVDEVDLCVPRGSMFGFIGPNGSGKTTTMRLILRIYQPDHGTVTVLGHARGNAADDRVGYLPEERGLYRRMTVRSVLRYFARLQGIRRPDRMIDQQLERLEASQWSQKRIEQLSKGMAQKIQFIVATIAKPELVILDEPFSGLDPVNLELLRDVVFGKIDRPAVPAIAYGRVKLPQLTALRRATRWSRRRITILPSHCSRRPIKYQKVVGRHGRLQRRNRSQSVIAGSNRLRGPTKDLREFDPHCMKYPG